MAPNVQDVSYIYNFTVRACIGAAAYALRLLTSI